jgi:hypothetical protein
MVQRRVTKGCCGRTSIIMTTTYPVRKYHVPLFQNAGFQCPNNYIKNGLLYAKKDGFIGTVTFGICNVNIRCNGSSSCTETINQFQSILEQIEKESGKTKPKKMY